MKSSRFDYDESRRPTYNQSTIDARRRRLVRYLYESGAIEEKKPARKTTHDAWIAKRRDKS